MKTGDKLELVKKVIMKGFYDKLQISKNDLIYKIMSQLAVSRRTSQEYVDCVLVNEELEIVNNQIKEKSKSQKEI